ncbi:hypothetical protein EAI_06396 [Harpegnathos saltator]|uniref:Uncharacterized protein n=1 Tax=Harpegnathos saltator TaxID=610380 RepID=E2BGK8_HARSA|nr:hypothetical protein EAI_06396 [Harpegnathos saltator]
MPKHMNESAHWLRDLSKVGANSKYSCALRNEKVERYNPAPPSYEECMQRAASIKDQDESNYVHGVNEPFVPRYPVFDFPTPCKNIIVH